MNYDLQALKDSFVVKSVSPLAATQCPLEESHRWKLRILTRSYDPPLQIFLYTMQP